MRLDLGKTDAISFVPASVESYLFGNPTKTKKQLFSSSTTLFPVFFLAQGRIL
jgi:hypothetical protein